MSNKYLMSCKFFYLYLFLTEYLEQTFTQNQRRSSKINILTLNKKETKQKRKQKSFIKFKISISYFRQNYAVIFFQPSPSSSSFILHWKKIFFLILSCNHCHQFYLYWNFELFINSHRLINTFSPSHSITFDLSSIIIVICCWSFYLQDQEKRSFV